MPIYYLLSGCDKEKGYEGEIINYFHNDLGAKNSIAFIATVPDNYEKNDRYFNININWFNNIEIKFNRKELIDSRLNNNQMLEIINNSEVIFLMGGDPKTQIEFIDNNNLKESLTNHKGIIIGMSAGSINMATDTYCSKDEDIPESLRYKGIGLVDINIEPHFKLENNNLIEEELFPVSKDIVLYGVPDNSAIRIEGDNITYIGDVYKISNMTITNIGLKEKQM